MAITINFPSNPTLNQTYSFQGKLWKYNGKGWVLVAATQYVPYTGATDNVDLGEYGLSAGYYKFDTTPTDAPTDPGVMTWDEARETIALTMGGVIQHLGQDVYFHVKNSSGATIPKGRNVRFAGTDGASGHILIEQFLADGTYPSTYYMGVTGEEIPNGSFGKVIHFGELEGFDTSGFPAGTLLYASTTVAGEFQSTAPQAPNNIILVAATLNSKNNGEITIRPVAGSNINNDEGVKIVTPLRNQPLVYNPDDDLWENGSVIQQIEGVVIPSVSFTLVSGFYEASVSNALILATSIVDIIPANASYTVVKDAEFLPQTDSFAGSVKVYCVNVPASDITVTLNIIN